jgi:thymidine kinase
MFDDPFLNRSQKSGWIEVITGSMFSGKTEELIRRLKRALLANQKIQIFKSHIDTRYSENNIVSHDANSMRSELVEHSKDLLNIVQEADVVGIDEAQFFDSDLPDVCNLLANRGIRVIVAGLDMDYTGNPFGPVPAILAIAESVTKVHAICVGCGHPAHYSHRKDRNNKQILIGSKDHYEPLCRNCYAELTL